jgi:putative oxidoreductase
MAERKMGRGEDAAAAAGVVECRHGDSHHRRLTTVAGKSSRGPDLTRLVIGTRLASALVFLVFGVGKFTNHASELASFREYGLPAPDAFVYAVGVVEIVGAVLLAIGLMVRPAALMLAGDMIGAIVVSGIARGETVSLTLAPALLVALIFLVLVRSTERSWSTLGRRARQRGPDRPA